MIQEEIQSLLRFGTMCHIITHENEEIKWNGAKKKTD